MPEFEFSNVIPGNYDNAIRIISGERSPESSGVEYLLWKEGETLVHVFEIQFQYKCSPFNTAVILGDLLAVGHEAYFYLYDLKRSLNLIKLKMEGYFNHINTDQDLFYVTCAMGIHCISPDGKELWRNLDLAIDGVIISKFENGRIFGSGEWDPPGGWVDFVVDQQNGALLEGAHYKYPKSK